MKTTLVLPVWILVAGVAALGTPSWASAQSSVGLSCGTNHCESAVASPGAATPLTYAWSFTGVAHFVPSLGGRSPIDTCNRLNAAACSFTCYQGYHDSITMHVNVVDANGNYVGDASANAVCDGSPM